MAKTEVRTAKSDVLPDFDLDEPKVEVRRRLKQAIREAGGNQVVAAKSGVPVGTVSNYIRGISDPKVTALGAIARACGVSLDWLVFGAEPEGGPVAAPVSAEARGDFAFLPRYGAQAAAGSGKLAVSEEVTDILAFRRDWLRRIGVNAAHAFLLMADGDSMMPTIPDGALMLVDGAIREPRDIRNGMIYVLVRSGTVIVKRIQFRLDDSIVLISDNPLYERETISRNDMNDLTVAGRVVWIGRAI